MKQALPCLRPKAVQKPKRCHVWPNERNSFARAWPKKTQTAPNYSRQSVSSAPKLNTCGRDLSALLASSETNGLSRAKLFEWSFQQPNHQLGSFRNLSSGNSLTTYILSQVSPGSFSSCKISACPPLWNQPTVLRFFVHLQNNEEGPQRCEGGRCAI